MHSSTAQPPLAIAFGPHGGAQRAVPWAGLEKAGNVIWPMIALKGVITPYYFSKRMSINAIIYDDDDDDADADDDDDAAADDDDDGRLLGASWRPQGAVLAPQSAFRSPTLRPKALQDPNLADQGIPSS